MKGRSCLFLCTDIHAELCAWRKKVRRSVGKNESYAQSRAGRSRREGWEWEVDHFLLCECYVGYLPASRFLLNPTYHVTAKKDGQEVGWRVAIRQEKLLFYIQRFLDISAPGLCRDSDLTTWYVYLNVLKSIFATDLPRIHKSFFDP